MESLHAHRIQLVPLTQNDLQLLARSRAALEESRGLAQSTLELSNDGSFLAAFDQAVDAFVLPNVATHPDQWLWYTHWLIVHREANLIIGGLGTGGPPNEAGETEIGYFIDKKFEGCGYTTEAVSCFLEWLFRQPDLQAVVAITPAEHAASQRVLQKNEFRPAGEVEEGVTWIKTR